MAVVGGVPRVTSRFCFPALYHSLLLPFFVCVLLNRYGQFQSFSISSIPANPSPLTLRGISFVVSSPFLPYTVFLRPLFRDRNTAQHWHSKLSVVHSVTCNNSSRKRAYNPFGTWLSATDSHNDSTRLPSFPVLKNFSLVPPAEKYQDVPLAFSLKPGQVIS